MLYVIAEIEKAHADVKWLVKSKYEASRVQKALNRLETIHELLSELDVKGPDVDKALTALDFAFEEIADVVPTEETTEPFKCLQNSLGLILEALSPERSSFSRKVMQL